MTAQKIFKIAVVAGVAGMLASVSAQAKPGVKIGSLKCNVAGGIGAIITSSKSMKCTLYKLNGKTERYSGVIRKYGLDIGITGKAKMVWLVFAPGKVNTHALRGTYVGASADASVIVGGGANVLVGGFNKSISLQPVSLQVQTGVNVAAGVTTLELR
ncbi:hypothetical protein MNBD_ALPHA08-326 [hydrothermal vent metagenome]|uniref:DUF992 domain-containing protein n=1 Tax=hydrothermal vent metagenome TaxID=652676 RepID=A0A3B0S5W5_9ZZZZ